MLCGWNRRGALRALVPSPKRWSGGLSRAGQNAGAWILVRTAALTSALRIWCPKERSLLNDRSQIHGNWTGRNFSWRSLIFSHFLADFSTSQTEIERNRGSLTCSLILQMSTYTWPLRKKKASDMQATGKGCISAKLLSLGKETLLSLAPKLCIYVWVCVCGGRRESVFHCKCSPQWFIKYLLTVKQIFGDHIYCKRVFQRRNGYHC